MGVGEMELGLPLDLLVGIPPPPIPSFLRDPVDYLVASNGSCNLCGWAIGDDAQLVQVISKYSVIEDLWYFGILSAVIGLIFIVIIVFVAALRCREAKVKPAHQSSCKSSSMEKVHSQVENEYMNNTMETSSSKSVWSPANNYGMDPYQHHQPVYEKVDYGSIVYSCPMLPKKSIPTHPPSNPPPPLPVVPPPPFCPSLRSKGMTDDDAANMRMMMVTAKQPRSNSGTYYDHLLIPQQPINRPPVLTRIKRGPYPTHV